MDEITQIESKRPVTDDVRVMRRVVWAMTAILAISLSVNLLLAFRIGRPKSSAQAEKRLPALAAGESASDLLVHNLNGQPSVISYKNSSLPVVLYFFTPQCSWCASNLANLKALASQKQNSYKFIAVSLTDKDLGQYLAANELGVPVFMNPSDDAMLSYRLGGTPQTIVVSTDGKVVQNWVGAYADKQQLEVEKFFGLRLPGLTSPPK